MKITSRFMSAVMALCMIMTTPAFAVSADQNVTNLTSYDAELLLITEKSDGVKNNNNIAEKEFNSADISLLASYDLINVEGKALVKELDKRVVQQLLDNGSIFYVPVTSIDEGVEVFEILSDAVYENERNLTGATINGVYVYNDNGRYRFSMHAARELIPENTNAVAVNDAGENATKQGIVDFDAIINHVRTLPEVSRNVHLSNCDENAVEVQLPTKTFDHEEGDTFSLYKTLLGVDCPMGSITITQYAYNICMTDNGDGTESDYYDVVTSFLIDADPLCAVDTYTGTISAKYTNLEIIDAETLESDTTNTISLTGGIGVDSDDVISGNVSASTSYTYNSNDQEILNDLAIDEKECNWKATPVQDVNNATWKLEPAARIKNTKGDTNKSGACSSLSDAKIWLHDVDGSGIRYTMSDLPIEISEFWNAGTSEN